ncbi:MAG: PEP-CTERM sorting domain-containing protein [Burkholderiaceae bacterium]
MTNPFARWMRSMAVVAGLLCGLATGPQAVAAESVYHWSGTCLDCGPAFANVAGVLTLQDYTPGSFFEEGDLIGGFVPFDTFQSFSYGGSDLVDSYVVEAPFFLAASAASPAVLQQPNVFNVAIVRGQIPDVANSPAPGFLEIEFDDGLFFRAAIDGAWSTCAPGLGVYYSTRPVCFPDADFGTASVFSTTPIPEPGIWLMLVAGLGVVGVMRRRRDVAA